MRLEKEVRSRLELISMDGRTEHRWCCFLIMVNSHPTSLGGIFLPNKSTLWAACPSSTSVHAPECSFRSQHIAKAFAGTAQESCSKASLHKTLLMSPTAFFRIDTAMTMLLMYSIRDYTDHQEHVVSMEDHSVSQLCKLRSYQGVLATNNIASCSQGCFTTQFHPVKHHLGAPAIALGWDRRNGNHRALNPHTPGGCHLAALHHTSLPFSHLTELIVKGCVKWWGEEKASSQYAAKQHEILRKLMVPTHITSQTAGQSLPACLLPKLLWLFQGPRDHHELITLWQEKKTPRTQAFSFLTETPQDTRSHSYTCSQEQTSWCTEWHAANVAGGRRHTRVWAWLQRPVSEEKAACRNPSCLNPGKWTPNLHDHKAKKPLWRHRGMKQNWCSENHQRSISHRNFLWNKRRPAVITCYLAVTSDGVWFWLLHFTNGLLVKPSLFQEHPCQFYFERKTIILQDFFGQTLCTFYSLLLSVTDLYSLKQSFIL